MVEKRRFARSVCVLACANHAHPCFCCDKVGTGQMGYR